MTASDTHTFVFADLAGFTALTEAHGDEAAADVALGFCRSLGELLPPGAEDFKMLGDSCLVRVPAAGDAVGFGLRVVEELAPRHGWPDVRVGMHTGTAVRRGDDWFGAAINVASRVAQLAAGGDVLVSETTKQAAGPLPGIAFEDCGLQSLRHVSDPVRILRARGDLSLRREGGRWVIDPVCRMCIDVQQSATHVTHEGTELYFCSALCAGQFVRAPERFMRDAGL